MSDEIHSEKRILSYTDELFDPKSWLNFVQMPQFVKAWKRMDLNDDDLRALEVLIMADPKRAGVISNTGGLRKIRFASSKSDSGKSGGSRVLFSYFPDYGLVCLWLVYPKNLTDNISNEVKQQLKKTVEEIKQYLACKDAK